MMEIIWFIVKKAVINILVQHAFVYSTFVILKF